MALGLLASTSTTDPVAQAKLLEIHRSTASVREAREPEQVVLAINRSDYMLDEPSSTLMQVSMSSH